jgi:DNA-binding NarL/FixJ family response regulator
MIQNSEYCLRETSEVAKSILIVDDNAFLRKVLCKIFGREEDLDVCGEAENGRDAIEKAEQLHPDLIILDLSMPVMNGLDAARVLRRLMPSVPLIMYSAFGDKFAEQQARLIGVSSLVSKSEPVATLIGKARSLLTATAA